jgi:cytosine/adenosine deaminase-related metal-dependent hydrolase
MKPKAQLSCSMVVPRALSPYDEMLLETAQSFGGFNNAHTHLDRGDTLQDKYLSHINTTSLRAASLPLRAKQSLTGELHLGLAYTEADLRERMSRLIEREISYGITRIATCIDATPDIGEKGLLAMRVANELKAKYAERVVIEIAPNPIFGFKEGTGRWEVFEAAAHMADFLSALPEKDDFADPRNRDGRVGFQKHLRMVMELGCKLKKEVHIHLDQANDPTERGTETLLEGLKWIDQPKIMEPNGQITHINPTVWVIHMISPSCYSEERFSRLITELLRFNVGVIVCPTAAISMRQLRPNDSPTHNSIARMLELCKSRAPVLIGTDNICDVFVPQSNGDMLTEILMGGHALRFAPPHVWGKLAAGAPLNEFDRATIGEVLYQDAKVFSGINPAWRPAVD